MVGLEKRRRAKKERSHNFLGESRIGKRRQFVTVNRKIAQKTPIASAATRRASRKRGKPIPGRQSHWPSPPRPAIVPRWGAAKERRQRPSGTVGTNSLLCQEPSLRLDGIPCCSRPATGAEAKTMDLHRGRRDEKRASLAGKTRLSDCLKESVTVKPALLIRTKEDLYWSFKIKAGFRLREIF